MAKRMNPGNATATQVTAQTIASHASHAPAARDDGTRSMRLQELPAERGAAGIVGDISREQIARDVRIGQFEKVHESGTFVTCRLAEAFAQISDQQEIEFLHAAAALPLKFAEMGIHRPQSVLALEHHLLDFGDGLRGIEVLRAGLGAIHDGVATIEPEWIFQLV
jgi:hypothetical protein